MNTKQWAVFFVTLLSFDYATATFLGYKGVPKKYDGGEGYYGWSSGCRCNEDLTSVLDGVLENVRLDCGRQHKRIRVKDHCIDEYEFKGGHIEGFHKFERKGPYRCSLSRDYVKIIFNIGFVRLLIHYTVSLVEEILTGFLGGIGSLIGRILGNITNFLFRCILPDLCVTVVINHRFGHHGFILEGLYLNSIQHISILNKDFSKHEGTLESYLKPVCDHALRNVLHGKLRNVFHTHFSKVTCEKHMFYQESSSNKYSEESDEYDYDGRDD